MRGWRLWTVWLLAFLGACFWFLRPLRHGLLLLLMRLVGTSIPQWDGSGTPDYWLDARAIEEFRVSHIANARWVGSRDFRLSHLEGIPKDATIVVYCSVGIRSQRIGQVLIGAGFTQVSNLEGGIFKWMVDGNEVVDSHNQITVQVHPYDFLWGIFAPVGRWSRSVDE